MFLVAAGRNPGPRWGSDGGERPGDGSTAQSRYEHPRLLYERSTENVPPRRRVTGGRDYSALEDEITSDECCQIVDVNLHVSVHVRVHIGLDLMARVAHHTEHVKMQ